MHVISEELFMQFCRYIISFTYQYCLMLAWVQGITKDYVKYANMRRRLCSDAMPKTCSLPTSHLATSLPQCLEHVRGWLATSVCHMHQQNDVYHSTWEPFSCSNSGQFWTWPTEAALPIDIWDRS